MIVVWTADGGALGRGSGRPPRALRASTGSPAWRAGSTPALPRRTAGPSKGVVQLRPDLGEGLPARSTRIRAAAGPRHDRPARPDRREPGRPRPGLRRHRRLLLGVALVAVLLILLLVYRSVLLPVVIILGAVFALGVACAVVYVLADHGVVRVDGQVQGILSILVIGAATDYALLLTARFREELGRQRRPVRRDAGRAAAVLADRSSPAPRPSPSVCSPCCSATSPTTAPSGRWAPSASSAPSLSTLTFLPAVLVLLGRAAYWPAKPGTARQDRAPATASGRRVAALRRPCARARCGRVTLAGLVACAAFAPTLTSRASRSTRSSSTTRPSVAATGDARASTSPAAPAIRPSSSPTPTGRRGHAAAARHRRCRLGRPRHRVRAARRGAARRSTGGSASTPRWTRRPTATRPRTRWCGCATPCTPSRARTRWSAATPPSSTTPSDRRARPHAHRARGPG